MIKVNISKSSSTAKLLKSKALFLLFFALFSLALFLPTPAKAATFEAGRIIDDSIFVNKNSMSVADIQNFLNSKVPTCNRWHAGFTGASGTVYSPPWTCLKEYNENPTTKQNNIGQFNPDGSPVVVPGGLSAAQIIWNAAQTYSINPQVILVTLQKETGLITDDWAASWQYRTAMGFGCPDGAPCDAQWFGFANQVAQGTRHFRNFFDGVRSGGFWTPTLPGVNTIGYNPNSACGSSSVNITTRAAAALYSYTPYQPNAAALNNLYGTGDACSAYGNRNFWRDFTGWFGATLTTAYAYNFVGSSYSAINLEVGQKLPGNFITIRNNGSAAWYADGSVPIGKGAVRMTMNGYGSSPFADISDPAWLGTRNQIKMTPAVVAPGENATFTFGLVGPLQPLLPSQLVTFIPVVDGVGFMPNINMQMSISHISPPYSFVSASGIPSQLLPNDQTASAITIKNTGSASWYADGSVPVGKNATRLSLKNYQETGYADRSDPAWLGTRNQIKMTPAVVAPGENATFSFKLVGPFVQHTEKLHFVPVLNGVTFMNDINMFTFVSTPSPSSSYIYVTAVNAPVAMAVGGVANVSLTLRNTGNTVWRNSTNKLGAYSTRLIMSNPTYRNSNFYNSADPAWLSAGQIAMTTPIARPGETAQFNFTWKAPTKTGLYQEGFMPVIDGYTLMPDFGMRFDTTVLP